MSVEKESVALNVSQSELTNLLEGSGVTGFDPMADFETKSRQLANNTQIETPKETKTVDKTENKSDDVTDKQTDNQTDKQTEDNSTVEENTVTELVNNVAIQLGIELVDDDGQPLQFEASQDGLIESVKTLGEKVANSLVSKFIEKNQIVLDFFNHIEAGNDPATFLKQETVDYTKLNYADENVAINTLTKYFEDKGIEKDIIETAIEKLKNDGKLEEKAKEVGNKLEAEKAKLKAQNEEAVQKKLEKQRQDEEKSLKEIETIVNSGKLLGNQLSSTEVKEFKQFLSGKNKEGKSQRVEAWNNLNTEQRLYLNYLVYKGLTSTKTATTSKTDAFAKAFELNKQREVRVGEQTKTQSNKTNNNLDLNVDLKELLGKED